MTRLEKLTCEATAILFGIRVGNVHSFGGLMTGIIVYVCVYAVLGVAILILKDYSDGDGA